MKELNELRDLVKGAFIIDENGIITGGFLPDGWSEEKIVFSIFPLLHILKTVAGVPFIDISETSEGTLIIATLDGSMFSCIFSEGGNLSTEEMCEISRKILESVSVPSAEDINEVEFWKRFIQ